MPIESAYVFMASMDVTPEAEDLFNEVYGEHAEYLRDVPGVRGITRMKGEPFSLAIGGETKPMPAPSPVYTAIYEIDDPRCSRAPNGRRRSRRAAGRRMSAPTPATADTPCTA